MDSTNKKYVMSISDETAQMLVSHARFVALVSETAAFHLIEEFRDKTKSLDTFPEPIVFGSQLPYRIINLA